MPLSKPSRDTPPLNREKSLQGGKVAAWCAAWWLASARLAGTVTDREMGVFGFDGERGAEKLTVWR